MSCSDFVGMIAWWSSTLLLLTTRPSGRSFRPVTYAAPFAYSRCLPTSSAVGRISGIISLVSQREFVRGYVIALCCS